LLQTKKELGAAEKPRLALKCQAADRQNWMKWRESGKEPNLAEAKELFIHKFSGDDASDEVHHAIVSRITLKPSGGLDDCTSFILWDLIENASQIVDHVEEHVFLDHLFAQAHEIVSERYGDVGDIHTFFVNTLYAEAQGYVSGAISPKDKSHTASA
jgi:hypothetical protein